MVSPAALPYEESAMLMSGISGWVCKTCRRFWGLTESPNAEHAARYCCASSLPCSEAGCQGRAKKGWTHCDPCREKKSHARWLGLEEADWDGDTPLVLYGDDHYFFGQEDLDEYLDEHPELLLHPEDLELVICVLEPKPVFDMQNHLGDHLPEGLEVDADPAKIEAHVNRWIEKNVPDVWTCGKKRPTLKSLGIQTASVVP